MTISLPPQIKKKLLERAKKENKPVSAIILKALQYEETLISEDTIITEAKQAKKDYLAGKTKVLKSLADLMD